ncbi:MAG: sensor histidine kinase [Microbacterium gubbeenense]|uniref:sensor histidine kinase n=1 Tax=Microbacterium gubbeenense TaxID=159896 RepID=UPI003F9C9783
MAWWRRTRRARMTLLILPTVIVLVCVGGTAAIAISVQRDSIRDATAERVSDVASGLADLDQVHAALETPDGSPAADALQPLASLVERAAGVDYVVVMDTNGVRLTHPTATERGLIVSTDSSAVLAGESVLEMGDGTIGRTLRAKVPVMGENGDVVGAISTGILSSRMSQDFEDAVRQLLPWTGGALVAGMIASTLLTASLRRRLRQYDDAARELETTSRMSRALREQSHEFDTRLHVIRGLVAHGEPGEALRYIDQTTTVHAIPSDPGFTGQPLLRATLEALGAELGALDSRLEADIDVESDVDDHVLLVVANLCRNAGEAGAARVHLTLREADGRFVGVVDDDGPGIAPETAGRLFARGYTTKTDPSGAGRGIGLDIVRRTVTGRTGSIEISSSESGGARFAFDMAVMR